MRYLRMDLLQEKAREANVSKDNVPVVQEEEWRQVRDGATKPGGPPAAPLTAHCRICFCLFGFGFSVTKVDQLQPTTLFIEMKYAQS